MNVLEPAECVATDSLATWWAATASTRAHASTIDRALAGGLAADRLGFAFTAGYQAALNALVPHVDVAALCATEAGGNHPRAIHTRLVDGAVTGTKTWATVATLAQSLLVVATTGERDGRPALVVARVAADAPGVTIRATSAPFVPEIPHAVVEFANAPVAEVLPGDGYAHYLKPFRTVEDIHVHAALVGYLIGVARRHELPGTERLAALAVALRGLAAMDRAAASTHVALAGAIELVQPVIAALEAAWSGGDEHARWLRDRALLQVAAKARAARLAKARSTV